VNSLSPVAGVELSLASGSGHTAIFAVSGTASAGGPFAPLIIHGYNEDMVVEAIAVQPGFLTTNTTATMDSGTVNARFTWYEQGYCPVAPSSGLPMAGTVITSESDPSYLFRMPYSYIGPDAIVLDSLHSNAVLTLVTPAKYSALSFLTAASGGAVVSQCAVRHANGQFETNSFTSPDWLCNSVPTITTHGRVSVSTKQMDYLESEGPRLFACDVALSDRESPVTHIVLSFGGTRADSRVVIFALSGLANGTPWPSRPVLSITRASDGRLIVQSSQPGKLQSCESWSNASEGWRDEGPISTNVALTSAPLSGARFYRVVVQ